jgi:hypothetical protein
MSIASLVIPDDGDITLSAVVDGCVLWQQTYGFSWRDHRPVLG